MMNTKSKVAIYCRLSEEDRNKQHETDDSNSIQNQKSMLIQYVWNKAGKSTIYIVMMITPALIEASGI